MTSFKIFIQARMSSNRLPEKVLMPFNGKPIIQNVVDSVGIENAVVLTSNEDSDDPLAHYLQKESIPYFRGSLNDVYGRFCDAIEQFNPDWVMRICADSPLIPSVLLSEMAKVNRGDADIITNVHPRSFPKGHSVEIIRSKTMLNLQNKILDGNDKEHVTSYFYRNSDKFKITSVTQQQDMSKLDMAVDTQEDYDRLSDMLDSNIIYNPEDWNISKC